MTSHGNTPGADERQRAVDAHVWGILRASGGWNARARARLAYFAATKRVEPWRIAAAVRRAAAGGGAVNAARTTPPVAEPAHADLVPPAADVRGTIITIAALVLGVAISGALVWVAMDQVSRANQQIGGAAVGAADAKSAGDGTQEPVHEPAHKVNTPDTTVAPRADRATPATSIAPPRAGAGGRTVPAAPAVFPRAPVLVGDLATPWVREALETLAAEEPALERAAARTAALTEPEQASILRAAETFLDAWPVLEPARRDAVINALVRGIAHLSPSEREGLDASLMAARSATDATARAWWRGAGAAGVATAFEGRAEHGAPQAFSEGALSWLHSRGAAVATAAGSAAPGAAADLCDAWLTALDAAASAGADEAALMSRDGAVLAALEALLRSGAPLDRPGTPADAAGSLLDALPWSSSTARRDRLVQSWKAWLADSSVPSVALHGATSVLAARRPGTWWDPWLVVDARATAVDRTAVAERLAGALVSAGGAPEAAPIALRGLDPNLLRRWRTARAALSQRPAPTADPMRVARAAEWMALVEAARLLERGRAGDADARLSQLEEPAGLAPDDNDRWRDRVAVAEVRFPPNDGRLEGELRTRRSLEDRLNVMRSLRTRPIRDLGPLDAQTLAHEALSASSAQVRSVAQGVIVDVLGQGPQMLSALLGEVAGAASGAEAGQLAASIAAIPAPRGNDAQMRAAAALILCDQLSALTPSERHQLNAATRELGLSAAASARLLGGDAVAGARPEQSMHAWADARAADAKRTVPPEVLDPILSRALARRRTAMGQPQLFVSDQTLLLELDAAVLVERLPRRRTEIQAVQQRAAAERAKAVDVFAQIDANGRALADLAAMAIGADQSGGGA